MADEPKCACGHPKEAHFAFTFNGVPNVRCMQCDVTESDHEYHAFRPAYSWPTEEGCWWINGQAPDDDGALVPAKFLVPCLAHKMLNRIAIVWGDKVYLRDDWEDLFGPALFTKLIEANPFNERNEL